MTQGKRYAVLSLAILAFGAARMPFESELRKEMDDAWLMPPKLDVKTGERIGQTFSAVSLGGLRTLVATFLNLRAFAFFSDQRWSDVEETYGTIVDLAPRTRYYWDTGAWHQAYNAASYYLYGETDLPPLRRKLAWRESILKGRDFLLRALRNNPDDPMLYESIGRLYADPNKIAAFGDTARAYEKSYEAYQASVDTGMARDYTQRAALYSLARVPGREEEALALASKLTKDDPRPLPTLQGLLYSLRFRENPGSDPMELVDSIFKTHEKAYDVLGNQWLRTRDHFPTYGVANALLLLEKELEIPEDKSVLKVELQSPMNPDDAFK